VVITSTTVFSTVSTAANGQQTTIVSSILTIVTQNAQPSGNNTNTNNTRTSTKTSSTPPLSTAPSDVTVDGGGPSGAPVPGQSGGGGIYGPNDNYTSSVMALTANTLLGSLIALIAGGILVLR
jgi:hypothetical protein